MINKQKKQTTMTKQEAIEYVKDSKIYVNGKSREIQKRLFALGLCWAYDGTTAINYADKPFIYIYSSGVHFMYGVNMDKFADDKRKELTAEEILNLTWSEDEPKRNFKPFDKVLVRDNGNACWVATLFSYCTNDGRGVITCNGALWEYCIPYEGNEHLVGTTDKPNN